MSRGLQVRAFLDDLSRLNRQQWLLRAVPLPATAVFLTLVALAGGGVRVSWVAAALLLGGLVTLLPDSAAGLGLLGVLAALWLLSVPEQLGGWTLAAGLDLLALHLAATLASYGPSTTVLGAAGLRAWLARGLLLAAVGAVVWGAARGAAGLQPAATGWAMAAGLVTLVGWVAYLGVRLATGGPGRGTPE
jgi:hypothetical protein